MHLYDYLAVTMGLPGLQLLRPPLLMRVETQIAYASGYLGFRYAIFHLPNVNNINAPSREVPSYLRLIQQLRHEGFCIDVLAVDGFGALHPRGAGAATQLGVQAGLCSIGVGKSLPGTCSLREREVVELMDKSVCLQLDIGFFCSAETMAPSGELKQIRCVAVRKDVSSRRPVYVTVQSKATNLEPIASVISNYT
jgi:deoxyinosine 3'endonuclease (endonuclease V)